MLRGEGALAARGRVLSFDRVFRNRRSVAVDVTEGHRELDSFQTSSLDGLRSALRPIYRHVDPKRQIVRFVGIEERSLPGGLMRTRMEIPLACLDEAVDFLAA